MLTRQSASVVQIPEFRPLIARVPLPEAISMRKDPLFGPRLLFVAPGAPDRAVDASCTQGVEQRHRLQGVAAGPGAGLFDRPTRVDAFLHAGDMQRVTQLSSIGVTKSERFREIVTGVDMQQREWRRRRQKRLAREPGHHDGILATGEEQHRPLELRRDLPQHVNRFVFECLQVAATRCTRVGAVAHVVAPPSIHVRHGIAQSPTATNGAFAVRNSR